MDASFIDANTFCPVCKKDVLLTETHCPHCNASADTTSPFLSFRRQDGSAGMIDQLTAAFLRSRCSEPDQADLDKLFARTSCVRIKEMVFQDNIGKFQSRLELTKADDLAMLRKYLIIKPTSWHLMMIGEFCIEFFDVDETVARIEIVGSHILRWSDRWKTDAQLSNPIVLAEFLQSRGFARLREDIDRDEEQERKASALHAAWIATWVPAIPTGLAPLALKQAWPPRSGG